MSEYKYISEKQSKAKINSTIDGKDVSIDAVIKPITKARASGVDSAKIEYYTLILELQKEYEVDENTNLPKDIEKAPEILAKMEEGRAKMYKAQADCIFEGEAQPIEFFASEDFEYKKMEEAVDFFLGNTKG